MFQPDPTQVTWAELSNLLKQYEKTGFFASKEIKALSALVYDSRGNPRMGVASRFQIESALEAGSRREKLFNNPSLPQDGTGTDRVIALIGKLWQSKRVEMEMKIAAERKKTSDAPAVVHIATQNAQHITMDEEDLALQWLRDTESRLSANTIVNYDFLKKLYDICLVSSRVVSESKVAEKDEICERITKKKFPGTEGTAGTGAAIRYLGIPGSLPFQGGYPLRERNTFAIDSLTAIAKEIAEKFPTTDHYVCCTLLKMPKVNPISALNVTTLIDTDKLQRPKPRGLDEDAAKDWLICLGEMYPAHGTRGLARKIVGCVFISHPREMKTWLSVLQQNGYQGDDPNQIIQFAEVFKDPNLISKWKKAAQDNGLEDSIEKVKELAGGKFKNPEDISALRALLKQNDFEDSVRQAEALAGEFSNFCPPIEPAVRGWMDWVKRKGGNIEDLYRVVDSFRCALGRFELWPNNEVLDMSEAWIRQWEKLGGEKFSFNEDTIQDISRFIELALEQEIKKDKPAEMSAWQGSKIVTSIKIEKRIKNLTDEHKDSWKKIPGCSRQGHWEPHLYYLETKRVKAWFEAASALNKISHEEVIAFAREQIANGVTDPGSATVSAPIAPFEEKSLPSPAVFGNPGNQTRGLLAGIISSSTSPKVDTHPQPAGGHTKNTDDSENRSGHAPRQGGNSSSGQ